MLPEPTLPLKFHFFPVLVHTSGEIVRVSDVIFFWFIWIITLAQIYLIQMATPQSIFSLELFELGCHLCIIDLKVVGKFEIKNG